MSVCGSTTILKSCEVILYRIFSMDEMQDPNHRQETEDYIRQLEGEDKVPSGKQLIR